LGSPHGGIGYEIEAASGRIGRWALTSGQLSYLIAVAPAVLAARAILQDRFRQTGLVPPERNVEPVELWTYLAANGIKLTELAREASPAAKWG
jgi:hypothetical protein